MKQNRYEKLLKLSSSDLYAVSLKNFSDFFAFCDFLGDERWSDTLEKKSGGWARCLRLTGAEEGFSCLTDRQRRQPKDFFVPGCEVEEEENTPENSDAA